MSKKRLLIAYHSAEYGGIEVQILDIIKELSSEIDIYVACPNGPLVEEYLKYGAVEHLEIFPKKEIDFDYINKIREVINREAIQIVHGHELKTGVQVIYAAFREKVPKRIYHVHTPFIFWKYGSAKRYFALVANFIANFITGNLLATDVLALTPYIKNVRSKYELILQSKIKVIPNAVRPIPQITPEQKTQIKGQYKLDPDKAIIGYVARFTPEKGQEVLLKAFRDNDKLMDTAQLILVGGGTDLEKLQKEYSFPNVTFTGRVSELDKEALLNVFDIFAFPTYAEGFGITLIEALSVGLPAIVSDLPVLHDVGDDEVQYFKKGDSVELGIKLLDMIENFHEIQSSRQPRIDIAMKYSTERFRDNYRELYLG